MMAFHLRGALLYIYIEEAREKNLNNVMGNCMKKENLGDGFFFQRRGIELTVLWLLSSLLFTSLDEKKICHLFYPYFMINLNQSEKKSSFRKRFQVGYFLRKALTDDFQLLRLIDHLVFFI